MGTNNSSRRFFLSKSSLAILGASFLPSSSIASVFNNSVPFEGYPYLIPFKNDLRTYYEHTVKVSGTLFSFKNGKQKLPNAAIEIWHLSPYSKSYNHFGKVTTDEKGNYSFITDLPNNTKGYMPRIYFKVISEGKSEYSELIVGQFQSHISHTHWEKHNRLGTDLFPKSTHKKSKTDIIFNLSIN